jgi:hypothetical protein
MKLGGIIYLHDISQTRMLVNSLNMFLKLCQEGSGSVIFGTTKWGDVAQDVGKRREEQLTSTYWQDMIAEEGSQVHRFEGTPASAWKIVHVILDKFEQHEGLQIQRDLVEFQQGIPETTAGQTLRNALQQLLGVPAQVPEELGAQTAGRGGSQMRQNLEVNMGQIRETLKQARAQKLSLPKRLMAFFRLKVSFVAIIFYFWLS